MSDLIDRQAAIDALEKEKSLIERPITETRWFDLGLGKAQEVLSGLPSAQPEIIRCKDCIYYRWEIDMCDYPYATAHNVVHENDYCSKAERRTDERPES